MAVNNCEKLLARWHSLCEQELIVSICHGTIRGATARWTVAVMHAPSQLETHTPYVARSFEHCIEIAETEAQKLLRAAATLARVGEHPDGHYEL